MQEEDKKEAQSEPKFKILVVDDDLAMLEFFKRIFRDTCEVSVALTGRDALSLAEKTSYDLAFIDVVLPSGMDGVEVLKELKRISPKTTAIMMSGYEIDDRIKTAFNLGASDFLEKPIKDITQILTLKEAAQFLKVTGMTVYRLANKGKIPASKVGKQRRFSQQKLEQWLQEKVRKSKRK